jgi:hypothetical protein
MQVGFVWDDFYGYSNGITRLWVNKKRAGGSMGDPSFRFAYGPPEFGIPNRDDHKQNTRWGMDVADPSKRIQNPPPLMRIGAEADPPLYGGLATDVNRPALNYTADATIDEFAHWAGANDGNFFDMYTDGRYYKENDATYTSPPTALPGKKGTLLPPAGTATPPAGSGGSSSSASTPVAQPGEVRLGIIAFSGYWPVAAKPDPGDAYTDVSDPAKPVLPDTQFFFSLDPEDPNVDPMPRQWVPLGGTAITNKDNNDPIQRPTAVSLKPQAVDLGGGILGARIRYRVTLAANMVNALNKPMLASPVLDDVTITYSVDPPAFLSWVSGLE